MYYPNYIPSATGWSQFYYMKKIVKIGKTTLKDFRKWGGAKQ